MSDKTINRIIPLDWLRGMCAISIMLYHFFFAEIDVFSKLGVYAVSTFFIISGLSMAIVYNNYIKGLKSSIVFFSRRLFRIVPIYAITCIVVVLMNPTINYGFWQILLNITTLFGFVNPSGYIPGGGWSIGNEMVFYLFTPFILFIYDRGKTYGNLFLILTWLIGLYFAFFLLAPDISIVNQWDTYINPFNNLFLFVSGAAIFYNFNSVKINRIFNLFLLIASFTLFVIYPLDNREDLVRGGGRIIFVLIVVIWVFSFYKMTVTKISTIGKIFETFGMATYGVYILHIVIRGVIHGFNRILNLGFPPWTISIVAVFVTIAVAIVSYYCFEIKISNWGKKMTKRIIR